MFVPQRVKNGVVCSAGALLGRVSARIVRIEVRDMVRAALLDSDGLCCELQSSNDDALRMPGNRVGGLLGRVEQSKNKLGSSLDASLSMP